MQSLLTASVIVLVFGAITAVLWVGAQNVIAGEMTAGTLGQFVLYAMIGAGSVGALTEVWSEVQRASGGMSRISELLDETSQLPVPAHPVPVPRPLRGEQRIEHVPFHYPTRPDAAALEDFSCTWAPGETVRWSARPGAGKRPFSSCCALHDPESGQVLLDDVDVRDIDPGQLRAAIALVPQTRSSSAPPRAKTSATASSTPKMRRSRPPPAAPRRTISSRNSPRLRQRTRRTRRAPVRRPAAAPGDRPRAAQGRADPVARRGDLRARRAQRARGAAGARTADGRPHDDGHRPSPGHGAQGRPHRRDGPRPNRRAGHARGADGAERLYAELARLQFNH
jgi:hypothetical protein